MAYLKGVLATVASLFLALYSRQLWWLVAALSRQQGNGNHRGCAPGFLESILSLAFWVFAVLFSVFFYFPDALRTKF